MNRQKINRFLFFCMIPTLLSGCWDRVEIEDRGFVIGTAIDLSDGADVQETKPEILMTNQFVVPGGLGSSTKGGSGQQNAYMNLSTKKDTIFENNKQMATNTSRTPYYEHLKIIVIAKEAAQVPGVFENVLDFFLRDHEMRRSTKVMIADGKAKEILGVRPKIEKLPVIYIDSIAENAYKSAEMLSAVRLGDVHENLREQTSFAVPKVELTETGVEIKGGAIINGEQNLMVGTINDEETKGFNFITGKGQSGSIKTTFKDQLVVFEFSGLKRRIKSKITDKQDISFSISIQLEGKIVESYSNLKFTDKEVLNQIEKKLSKEVERLANLTIEKSQEEMRTDFLGLGHTLRRQHFDKWGQIKNDWDQGENFYAKSDIKVKADVKIRDSGSILSTGPGR